MTEIIFDKKHWPKSGTTVNALPTDLMDLWDNFEDQASTFVAEALIDNPPHSHIYLKTLTIETFLWTVGGDCVCSHEPLAPMIKDAIIEYADGRPDVKKELLECWERLQKAIDKETK